MKTKTYKTDYISIDLYKLNNTNIKDYIHTIIVDYPKGNYHETFNVTSVYSINPRWYYSFYTYKKSVKFEFSGPKELTLDKLVGTIDGEVCQIIDNSYDYILVIPDTLSIGQHVLDITYLGDSRFYKNNYTQNITVHPEIQYIGDETLLYGEESNVVLILPENATGFLNVYLNNELYASSPIINGLANITIKNILPGSYNITAYYNGSDYDPYPMFKHKDIEFYYWFDDAEIDENPVCYFRYIPNEIKDNIIITFEDKNYTGNYNGDILEIKTEKASKIGDYYFKLLYVENNTILYSQDMFIRIYPSCNMPSKVTNGKEKVTVNATGREGEVTLIALSSTDHYTLTSKLSNGKATFSLEQFNKGTYSIYLIYNLENMFSYSKYYTVKVYNYKLTSNGLTKYYGSSSSFKVKLTDKNSKILKSKYVKFYINGKYVKKVKTNKKGIATLKIGKAPGLYKVTVKYGKVEITRNLKVKHALTLKTAKVKRTAKKLVLTATLKVGKKALKYKKVTFKFNGKTYTAKTNKKGVAKVTIKKATLKKLKAGKTVKYQAKYSKDVVKKVATVI